MKDIPRTKQNFVSSFCACIDKDCNEKHFKDTSTIIQKTTAKVQFLAFQEIFGSTDKIFLSREVISNAQ